MSIHMTDDEHEVVLSQPAVLRYLADYNRRKLAQVEPRISIECDYNWRMDAQTMRLQARIEAYESLARAIEMIDPERSIRAGLL